MDPRAAALTWLVVGGSLGSVAVVAAEALLARRRGYLSTGSAPAPVTAPGESSSPRITLALLGDSTAAGVGAAEAAGTVGAQLASLLTADGLPARIHPVAVSGSRVRDLGPQVSRALLGHPDLAVVLVGANDAIGLSRLAGVRVGLVTAVHRLRSAGVPVVVGTCPDLGSARAFAQPLRALAGMAGRRVAGAQRAAVQAAGGQAVDLAALTGPAFRRDPALLASDDFHPSDAGYAVWARALVPAVRELARASQPS